jgi:polysaccharide deacetylase 2 family uncharacterized protein YibQ
VKLPFNLPKFGKKEVDEDDDEEDSDFDPSELEGAPAVGLDDENIEDETVLDDVLDEPTDEDMGEALPSEAVSLEIQSEESLDAPDGQDGPIGVDKSSVGEATAEDNEELKFSDDDNENSSYDEDEEEDEEEDEAKPKKKLFLVGGGATAVLILIGGTFWYSTLGGTNDESSNENSKIPKVAMDIAPKTNPKVGGLNALIGGSAGAGASPTKLLVPVISPMAFASLAPPKVTDSPLGESNDPALSEESPQGLLPRIAKDGRQAWQVYAKPFVNESANRRVSIVVMGLGQSMSATNAAINLLPGNVTLAFDPYAPNLSDWMRKARAAGHEVMLMVPLEPTTFPYDDPGPLGLMTVNALEENRLRLENILSLMTGYIGVMTVMGSKFNTSDEHLRSFLDVIKKRGLMFLEGAVNPNTLAPKIAKELGLPYAVTNIVLDLIPTKSEIDVRLAELEKVLAKKPAAVAIAGGYPSSIERIAAWTTDLQAKNLVLAPLSALANKQSLE